MGSRQNRLCLFYLRDGLVTNKLGKAYKYSLVQIYYYSNSYLFTLPLCSKIQPIVSEKT